MTLKELFDYISNNPNYSLIYFVGLPLVAGVVGILGNQKCNRSPWKEFFMIIIYGTMIPGIFALFFNLYLFLFENSSILNYNIIIQILPILSMLATLFIIRRYIGFNEIPGFDKISGLILVISSLILILWLADRFRIIAFTYMPIQYLLLLFIALIIAINWGIKRLMN